MTTKIKTDSDNHCQSKNDEMLADSLKRFVKMVKSNVINQPMSSIQSGDMIQNAENIERKLLGECSHSSDINNSRENGELCLDPILHHRVLLAPGHLRNQVANGLLQFRERQESIPVDIL